jgi:hypothetical protein
MNYVFRDEKTEAGMLYHFPDRNGLPQQEMTLHARK